MFNKIKTYIKTTLCWLWERIKTAFCRLWKYRLRLLLSATVLAVIVIAFWGFFYFIPKHLANEKNDNDNLRIYIEAIKTLVLILGGIGGLCGLVIAVKRQEKFEQQVDISQRQTKTSQEQVKIFQEQVKISQKQTKTSQSQLFNERLGRGIEQLASEDVALRSAGIRILDNLAETASPENTKLIVEIIHTYLRTKAIIKLNETRDDIAYAINTIFRHREKAGKSHNDIPLSSLDLSGLYLSDIDLTGAFLWYTNLTKAFLWGSNLTGASLRDINLTGANLSDTNLKDVEDFTQAQFDQIIYDAEYPPKNFPNHLTLPADRAYIDDQDGKSIFVISDKDWSGQDINE